jgi:hydrogenase/urease accessory protein HupE
MEDFFLYFKMGLNHVLDFSAYDHILFLIVLAVVFTNFQWKNVIWLVTLFTIGHSITLALSAYEVLKVRTDLIEFLIPLTIFITGVINIIDSKKDATKKGNINLLLALFFGLIHGIGFSNYFKMMVGQEENKILPLIEFGLGIELAQVIIVVSVLIIGMLLKNLLRVDKRDWILVCSSIVVGFSIQMMMTRAFW